jgi:hypothetical protein
MEATKQMMLVVMAFFRTQMIDKLKATSRRLEFVMPYMLRYEVFRFGHGSEETFFSSYSVK